MNTVPVIKYCSVEDYLAVEEVAEFKSEYYAGEIFSMAGGTLNHNRIAGNVHFALRLALKGKPFEVFISDVKIHAPNTDSFTYPGLIVIKGQPEYWQDRRDTVRNAHLLVEVLSNSTKDYDRGGKFEIYRHLPGLRDYILISQDKIHVEHFVKQAPNQWLLTEYGDLHDQLSLAQLGETLALHDVYDKVDFAA